MLRSVAWRRVALYSLGGVNGFFSVLEDIFKPYAEYIHKKFLIDENTFMYKLFRRIVTFVVIDFTWLFFRAKNLGSALYILGKIKNDFRPAWLINFNFVDIFSTSYTLMVIIISLFIIIAIDILNYYGKDIKAAIFKQQIVFRWIIYIGIMLVILYWGLYGTKYEQTQFIYFQF